MVYADPPYNTGDDFIYKDNYQHSTWLTMMDNRLRLVHRLLADEGRFFCSIDDRENDNLLKLLKAIWSSGTFLGSITWEKRTKPQNTETAAKMLQSKAEYIHPFVKAASRQEFFREPVEDKQYPERDKVGVFRVERLEEMSAEDIRARATMVFDVLGISPRPGKQWKVGQSFVNKKLVAGDIFLRDGWPCQKIRPDEEDAIRYRPFWSHFFDKETYGTAEEGREVLDQDLGFGKGFQTVKPLKLLEKLIFHSARDGGIVLDPFAGSGTTAHAVLSVRRTNQRDLRFIMCEAGPWFDSLLVPRIKKIAFANTWIDGRPGPSELTSESDDYPSVIKIVGFEQYEDTLNNLEMERPNAADDLFLGDDQRLREEYILRYMLDVESRGSASLLDTSTFVDPRRYSLRIKSPGSDETKETNVDLIETFNWLLGLRVKQIAASETFSAKFTERDMRLSATLTVDDSGEHWFRQVRGLLPDGRDALIVWRTLTGNVEHDEAVLLSWFDSKGHLRSEMLDVVYVNGDCNLAAVKPSGTHWEIEPIEARFEQLMFDGADS
jgi:adenine-specific DNA-methyltransferase